MKKIRDNIKMISVIMSTYKEEENLIRKSIESILNQSYKNFEYIIILDNPDNHIHERVIEEYAAKDARIQFLINKDEHGRTIALNRAINLAKGEYIAIMDADDIALPNRFSDELEYIEKYNYDLIGGITQVIDEEGNDLYGIKKIPSNPEKIYKCLKYGQVIAHPTWLGKTEVFKAINGYRPMPLCEDYDFTLRAALKGFKISNINKPVLKYRMTANSVSRSNLFEQYLYLCFITDAYKHGLEANVDEAIRFVKERNSDKQSQKYSKANVIFNRMLHEISEKQFIPFIKDGFCLLVCSKYFLNRIYRFVMLSLNS